jgi:quercetin dioxygenase-like cupin family protein
MNTSRILPVIRSIDKAEEHTVERSVGARIQVLLGPDDGAPHFIMRRFTLDPGGSIPEHRHPLIEHEQLMLEGEMHLSLDGEMHIVHPGDCILIPAGVFHSYENRGKLPVRFLCIIPRSEDYETEWL